MTIRALATGGNKTRKLEYLPGKALLQGADSIITAGAQQSPVFQIGHPLHLVVAAP